jgi:hypothetical protein
MGNTSKTEKGKDIYVKMEWDKWCPEPATSRLTFLQFVGDLSSFDTVNKSTNLQRP